MRNSTTIEKLTEQFSSSVPDWRTVAGRCRDTLQANAEQQNRKFTQLLEQFQVRTFELLLSVVRIALSCPNVVAEVLFLCVICIKLKFLLKNQVLCITASDARIPSSIARECKFEQMWAAYGSCDTRLHTELSGLRKNRWHQFWPNKIVAYVVD